MRCYVLTVTPSAAEADRCSCHPGAGQGDRGAPGRVSRSDVVAVAIAALDQPAASNRKAIELADSWASAPEAELLRQHVFLGTIADV